MEKTMSLLQTIKSNGSDRSTMGASVTSSASKARSNDTVAYGAVDVVGGDTTSGTVYEFTGMGMAGADVLITGTELQIDVSSIPSGQTSYVLYLYGVTPPSATVPCAPRSTGPARCSTRWIQNCQCLGRLGIQAAARTANPGCSGARQAVG
jgi:hypothetical protein